MFHLDLMVAVKKITSDARLGFPMSALRELKCLNLLKHSNIICLLEVAREVHEKGSPENFGKNFRSCIYYSKFFCLDSFKYVIFGCELMCILQYLPT